MPVRCKAGGTPASCRTLEASRRVKLGRDLVDDKDVPTSAGMFSGFQRCCEVYSHRTREIAVNLGVAPCYNFRTEYLPR